VPYLALTVGGGRTDPGAVLVALGVPEARRSHPASFRGSARPTEAAARDARRRLEPVDKRHGETCQQRSASGTRSIAGIVAGQLRDPSASESRCAAEPRQQGLSGSLVSLGPPGYHAG